MTVMTKNGAKGLTRALALLLVFAMVLGFFPALTSAAYAEEPSGQTESAETEKPAEKKDAQEEFKSSSGSKKQKSDPDKNKPTVTLNADDARRTITLKVLKGASVAPELKAFDASSAMDAIAKAAGEQFYIVKLLSFEVSYDKVKEEDEENYPKGKVLFRVDSPLLQGKELKNAKLYRVLDNGSVVRVKNYKVYKNWKNSFTFQTKEFGSYVLVFHVRNLNKPVTTPQPTEEPIEAPEVTEAPETPVEPPETTDEPETPVEPPETTDEPETPVEPPEVTETPETPVEPPEATDEPPEATDEPKKEDIDEFDPTQPGELKMITRTIHDEKNIVTISGKLPANATVTARALSADEIAKLALVRVKLIFAYDITIWVDGEEYQPDGSVSVSINDKDMPDALTVTHIKTDEDGKILSRQVVSNATVKKDTVSFTTDGFSIYIGTVTIDNTISLASGAGYRFYNDPACLPENEIADGNFNYAIPDGQDALNIYIKADEGYAIDSVSVKNAKDGSVSSLAAVSGPNEDGVYTVSFAAPADDTPDQVIDVSIHALEDAEVTPLYTIDLGYQPDENSNDSSMPTLLIPGTTDQYMATQTIQVAAPDDFEITLGTPQRFGYVFNYWTKVCGGGPDTQLPGVSDTTSEDELAQGVVYVADWTPDLYPLALSVTSLVDTSNIRISSDGSDPSLTLQEWVNAHSDIVALENVIYLKIGGTDSTKWIQYGETLGQYFSRLGLTTGESVMPKLKDIRGAAEALSFTCWTSDAGDLSSSSVFSLGEGGLLTRSAGTFASFNNELKASASTLNAAWRTREFTLTISGSSDFTWRYAVKDQNNNDVWTDITGASTEIPRGATVEMKVPVSSTNLISYWNIIGSAKILPVEQTYHAGDQNIVYHFTMPAADVSATYVQDSVYVPIQNSPIIFEEGVSYNNRTLDGFWFAGTFDGMTPLFKDNSKNVTAANEIGRVGSTVTASGAYFYPWNSSKTFYVTSNNVPTTNQIVFVNTANVSFKNCCLEVQSNYSSDFIGRYKDTMYLQMKLSGGVSNFKYGNIVFATEPNPAYTINVYVDGANTLGVFAKSGNETSHAYQTTLKLTGRNSGAAGLACVMGMMSTSFNSLTINAYPNDIGNKDNSEYLVYTFGAQEGDAPVSFSSCTINAPNKTVHSYYGKVSFSSTKATLKSFLGYGIVSFSGSTTMVHTLGNALVAYGGLNISSSAKVLIDGSLLRRYCHDSAGSSISDGVLIVKGAVADLGAFSMSGGLVIANAVSVGRYSSQTGGTIVANLFANNPVGFVPSSANTPTGVILNDDYITPNGSTSDAVSNGDNIPFVTHAANGSGRDKKYSVSGGSMYLLGYYPSGSTYDLNTSIAKNDTTNPVSALAGILLNDDWTEITGTSSSLDATTLQNAVTASAAVRSGNECLMAGNSAYSGATGAYRSFSISGTAKIYSAGNLTFYNDTSITNGTIVCYGNIGCKHDLTISGGNITAKAIGNVRHLSVTENGLTRWKTTTISGSPTITTDLLGAVQQSGLTAADAAFNRSTIVIAGMPTFAPKTSGGDVNITDDMYINYVANADEYTVSDSMPNNVRFTGKASSSSFDNSSMQLVDDSLAALNDDLAFTAPTIVGGGDGSWLLDGLSGPIVDKVKQKAGEQLAGQLFNGDTIVSGTDVNASAYADRTSLDLYAAKSEYTLTLMNPNTISATAGGTAITLTDGTVNYEWQNWATQTATVQAGASVVITPNDSGMLYKTVVWYYDDNGILHNVKPTFNETNHTVSFTMPRADISVWVTNELILYLDQYEIAFTPEGFRVEYAESRNDSTFIFSGDLRIRQSNIRTTRLNSNKIQSEGGNGTYLDYGLKTINRMIFESGSGNVGGRKITLDQIVQNISYANGSSNRLSYGIWIVDGVNVELKINGAVSYSPIRLHENSSLTIKGNGTDTSAISCLPINRSQSTGAVYTIGNTSGKTGTVTIQDLTQLFNYDTHLIAASTASGKATFNNVVICACKETGATTYLSSSSGITTKIKDVTLSGCDLGSISAGTSYATTLIGTATNLTLHDTTLKYYYGSTYGGYNLFYSVSNVTISGTSDITQSLRTSTSSNTYFERCVTSAIPTKVILKDSASLTSSHRVRLKALSIADDAVFKVTKGTNDQDGILQATEISMTGGTLNADYVVFSGYYTASSFESHFADQGAFDVIAAAGTPFQSGSNSSFVMDGGTVNAGKFIGGSMGGSLKVNGGTINSPAIGTYDVLFGASKESPTDGGKWFFVYQRIPNALTVSINNSAIVNVGENGYLGGMRATVNVNGGKVNLADGAVLGMTEAQKETLKNYYSAQGGNIASHNDNIKVFISGEVVSTGTGSINAPYGSVRIMYASAAVSVYDMKAERGSITIDGASKQAYDNAYITEGGPTNYLHTKVAVNVSHEMTAQTIEILNKSVVYANSALANVPAGKTGGLRVQINSTANDAVTFGDGDPTRAFLYTTTSYGAIGDGTIWPADENYRDVNALTWPESNQNVFGKRIINVQYVLNPKDVIFDYDVDTIVNDNVEFYEYKQGENHTLPLNDPSCLGYTFKGWYVIVNGEEVDYPSNTIDTEITVDRVFYAKWERVKVPFRIFVNISNPDDVNDTLTQYGDSGNTYYFNELGWAEYGSTMLSSTGIVLSNYSTNSDTVSEVSILDQRYLDLIESTDPELVTPTTKVSKAMVQAYQTDGLPINLGDGSVVLWVSDHGLLLRNIAITFTLNLTADKHRPIDAEFNYSTTPQSVSGETIMSYVAISDKLYHGQGFEAPDSTEAERKLLQPSAPGYTFGGWYTDQACTDGNEVNALTRIREDLLNHMLLTIYAKWTPNTYNVKFDSGSEQAWVTVNDTAPGISTVDPYVPSLTYTWTYDTFCDGGAFKQNGTVYSVLPSAWKEGFVFEGWEYTDKAGNKQMLTAGTEFNLTNIDSIDVNALGANDIAITFTAKFREIKVTYDLNGGRWVPENYVEPINPAYGTPLPGYTQTETVPANGNLINASATNYNNEYGTAFRIVGTSVLYFEQNNAYITNDYRNTLIRKGYSFYGWKSGSTYYGSIPRFEDVDLVAEWHANDYKVIIFGIDSAYSSSYESKFNPDAIASTGFGTSKVLTLTVGQEINVGVNNWPARDATGSYWFASNTENPSATDDQRLVLGATFAPMDPGLMPPAGDDNTGSAKYHAYADAVTNLLNNGTLFQTSDHSTPGTTFYLPEDTAYNNAVSGATVSSTWRFTVPDYPEQSTIKLYAVYRERSLVFVEYYNDTEEHETVLKSFPWQLYSTYPWTVYDKTPVENKGFTLQSWYVNTKSLIAEKEYSHDDDHYNAHKADWKNEATNLGTYDIIVYTVYLAQDNKDIVLEAKSDPVATNESPLVTQTYTIPNSMQHGYVTLVKEAVANSVNLVSVDTMLANALDPNWSGHDDTVAIVMTVNGVDYDLSSYTALNGSYDAQVGDDVTFTLYHSKLMTSSELKDACKLEFSFDNDTDSTNENPLSQQSITLNVKVQFTPSLYDVTYTATLPEDIDALTVTDWNGFDQTAPAVLEATDVPYGTENSQDPPAIEGYTPAPWTRDLTDLADGRFAMTTSYTPIEYDLQADQGSLDRWSVVYTEHLDSTTTHTLAQADVNADPPVKYHSTVTITPSGSQYPEFITIELYEKGTDTLAKSFRLDSTDPLTAGGTEAFITVDGGVYSFRMPAYDVRVKYSDVQTLYLDEGSIDITRGSDGYTFEQNGVVRAWHGDYVILQNANDLAEQEAPETNPDKANKLTISGDFTGKTVELGNLYITSDDSIELEGGTTVTLTTQGNNQAYGLNLKNILVPKTSSLSMQSKTAGESGRTKIALAPNYSSDKYRSAIGGSAASPANGAIDLSNLDLQISMVGNDSGPSGIGPAAQDPSATDHGAITISNCAVSVKETIGTGQYRGAWIGGSGVSSVSVSGTTVKVGSGSVQTGSHAIDGKTVTLNGCTIGESTNANVMVPDPIHAQIALNITDSTIYLVNKGERTMIGADGDNYTTVTNSTIQVLNNGTMSELYTGVMKIMDAKSDVTINNTQVVEVSNGDMTITASGITQGEGEDAATHSHAGLKYLLLEELNTTDKPGKTANDLTVSALADNATITVKQPHAASGNTAVTLDTASFTDTHDEINVILKGDLTVTGTTTIADANTLSVESKDAAADDRYTLDLQGGFVETKGSFAQKGGNLTGAYAGEGGTTAFADLKVGGNMTLDNVIATVGDAGKLGSTGLDGVVTTVTIKGGTTVTADIFGALGAQNDTFTFVVIEDGSSYSHKMVQDHYRLEYVDLLDGWTIDPAKQPTVLRTETLDSVVTVLKAIPDPYDDPVFSCWYILSEDGTQKLALMVNDDSVEVPAGLDGKTLLAGNTASSERTPTDPADTTDTLLVHVWLVAQGKAYITEHRVFQFFTGEDETVTVLTDDAWTARLESSGGRISNRDYRVDFSRENASTHEFEAYTLPAGTKLTLALKGTPNSYYYYTVPAGGVSAVKFSDFTRMGTASGSAPALAVIADGNEEFLLSADFSDADATAVSDVKVGFSLIVNTSNTLALDDVSYTLSGSSVGAIEYQAADTVKVTANPGGDWRYSAGKVYLVASIDSGLDGRVPLNAAAALNDSINGVWISEKEIAFELGNYGADLIGAYAYSFTGLPGGNYQISWRLCAGSEAYNCTNCIVSNVIESQALSVNAPALPSLDVTKPVRIVYKTGAANSLNFTLSYENVTIDMIAIKVQKQTALASFADAAAGITIGTIDPETNTVSISLGSDIPKGTYRVVFSIDEDSANDNVYFSFIVE